MIVNSAVEVIRLVNDLVGKGGAEVLFDIQNSTKRGRSVSKLAQNAILEYPVIASKSLNIADLTMASKALERQYATYVRLAMSMNDEIKSGEEKADYINKFHTKEKGRVSSLFESAIVSEDSNSDRIKDLQSKIDKLNATSQKKDREIEDLKRDIKYMDVRGRYDVDPTKSPYKNQLLDNDIKKANELVPTTLDIAVRREGYDGFDHILLGVKTVIHGVNSEEMIQNVSSSLREKRNLFRFIQWTTGEIKFFKDYLFAIDRLKTEAVSSRKDSRWWRLLKVKSRMSQFRRLAGTKNQLIPNCTIVMSMDEVEYLKNIYDIDLLNNNRTVRTLIETYFLMGFVILDSASEVAYFYFDGNDEYQTYSYASLERENSNPQRDLKNMLSLMGR